MKKRRDSKFTDEQKLAYIAEYEAGVTLQQIADRARVSVSAVYFWVKNKQKFSDRVHAKFFTDHIPGPQTIVPILRQVSEKNPVEVIPLCEKMLKDTQREHDLLQAVFDSLLVHIQSRIAKKEDQPVEKTEKDEKLVENSFINLSSAVNSFSNALDKTKGRLIEVVKLLDQAKKEVPPDTKPRLTNEEILKRNEIQQMAERTLVELEKLRTSIKEEKERVG